ncbi:MAG TPA: DNA (cytosine-5-)-methyltransferase [Steroidobacteraceae bacterium]|nr:DNA (cytosine-5-)-methyltransferase [Steroidobacteraceae bacterium]
MPKHEIVGLFAGIGGLERGLHRAGHLTILLCETDAGATAVLKAHFPDIAHHDDVTTLESLPKPTTLVVAGFPCQDLSQAGQTAGIAGLRSGLVGEVFRLVQKHKTPWVLLENVPFMLQLNRGRAMDHITDALETLGYRWAYRVIDSRALGRPQRRRRVYLLASLTDDPRTVLFADEAGLIAESKVNESHAACGFYWTEGIRGLGWAVDAIPTLKGGSTVGIPSPPAILLPTGEVVTPDLRDAERLQGFPSDWTKPAETVGRTGRRWKLVGNAVSVPAAEWIGRRMADPGRVLEFATRPIRGAPWPTAAWNVGNGRVAVEASEWPVRRSYQSLSAFLKHPPRPLSLKATRGFLERTGRSGLIFPIGFLSALRAHETRMAKSMKPAKSVKRPSVQATF